MLIWEPLSINDVIRYVSLYERTTTLLELKHSSNGIIWERPKWYSDWSIHITDKDIYYEMQLFFKFENINNDIECTPILDICVKYNNDIKPMDKQCGKALALKLYSEFKEIYDIIADCLNCSDRLAFEYRLIDQIFEEK